jgi:two-component system, chemotaxis family, protein-glutamate methylesterase/glutaminase
MTEQASDNQFRVLVVDDSALMSRTISNILSTAPDLKVVGRARDGLEALSLVEQLKPDVVTLDVEMPRMGGITALKHIMIKHAVPTVMISSLTTEGARTTYDAFRFGAIDVIAKPSRREDESMEAQQIDIISKVRRAASIRNGRTRYIKMSDLERAGIKRSGGAADSATRLIGAGTGTGGYYVLLKIVPSLPADFQDVIVAVMLVSPRYVATYAEYLDDHSAISVKAAREATVLEKGTCYVVSGQERFVVTTDSRDRRIFRSAGSAPVDNGEPQGPIDTLLASLGSVARDKAVAVIMTGSGEDGAIGCASVRKAGGVGLIQDINNCMDPSMPIAALEKGSVDKILPDYLMVDYLMGIA